MIKKELLKAIEDMPMEAEIWINHPDLGLTALEEVKVSYKYNQIELY